MANIMSQRTKYLIGKWGKRIQMVEKAHGQPLNYERRAALANSLENTAQRIAAMEATNPGNIGAYKRYALDIVTSVIPNLIAFDIYAVQPLDNRIGMLNYINYNYSKPKGQTKAGDTFMSSINKGISDPHYSSDLVKDEIVAQAGVNTVKVDLPWWPVIPNTFTVESGSVIGSSDASGTITGTGVSGTITTAGTLDLTFTSETTDDVVVTYRYDNESVRSDGPGQAGFTNVPEVELEIKSVPVEAQARTMRAFWSFDASYELTKEYGQDIETLLATQVTGYVN